MARTNRGHFFDFATQDNDAPCVNCTRLEGTVQITVRCAIRWGKTKEFYEFPVCSLTCGHELMELIDDALYDDGVRGFVAQALLMSAAIGA